jgi:hypothetical protein
MVEVRAGDLLKKGMILLWSGTIATIPTGWALCNGSNGTPDLRNRFVVCANADSGGLAKTTVTGSATQTGGSVSHEHIVVLDSDGVVIVSDEPFGQYDFASLVTSENHLNPYYALAYIMKL